MEACLTFPPATCANWSNSSATWFWEMKRSPHPSCNPGPMVWRQHLMELAEARVLIPAA
jgi:hypothetical protein